MTRTLPALLLLAVAACAQTSDAVSPFREGEQWVWLKLDRASVQIEPVAGELYWTARWLAAPGTNAQQDPVFLEAIGTPCLCGEHCYTAGPDGIYVCAPEPAAGSQMQRRWRWIGWGR